MDKGRIVEVGTYDELANDPFSQFSKLKNSL
jgi:ABC-type multidrug transport system fused ATPase/permease subunit